jgi:hypothetical protein
MPHEPDITDYKEDRDHRGQTITTDDVRNDILRVARICGRQPTEPEYRKYGIYSSGAVHGHFGSWNDAMDELGYEPRSEGESVSQITDEDALQALRDAAEELGHPPRARSDAVEYCDMVYYRRFGSWLNALEQAGLEPEQEQLRQEAVDKVEFHQVVEAIVDLAADLDRPPYEDELREDIDFTIAATQEIAGTWAETLRMAGFPPRYPGGLYSSPEQEPVDDYGWNWPQARQDALNRDRFRCQDCGIKQAEHTETHGTQLHVHHIKPIRSFDEPEAANFLDNLITLCEDCHRKWEPVTQKAMRDAEGVTEAVVGDE